MFAQNPSQLHPEYRPDIDGLRAVAVLSVVAFHASPIWIKGGFIGVDIFFVISGFLISTIIFKNIDAGAFSFIEFYKRRVLRIFPALLVVLVATYLFGWFALFADEYKQLGKHIAAGAGFVSNIALWTEAGYFDNTAETKPLLHLWSLGIEEQFYIFWPLLLWGAWKIRFNFFLLIACVGIVSFYFNIENIRRDATATFYSPQTRIWELLAGSFLAWVILRKSLIYERMLFGNETSAQSLMRSLLLALNVKKRQEDVSNILSAMGILILALGFFIITKEFGFPGKWAALPVVGAALIIGAGPRAWFNRVVLSNPIAVWFGLISYPLYLWHWPILSFARIVESGVPNRSIRIVAVLASIMLAWMTYQIVEKPIRFHRNNKFLGPFLITTMVVVGYIGYNTYIRDGLAFRSSVAKVAEINTHFVGPLWKYTKNDACLKKYPLKDSGKYGWWFCMASSSEKPTLLLLGSSYSNHLYPGIANNPELNHHSILSIGTCDAAWVEKSELSTEVDHGPCSGYRSHDQMEFINDIARNVGSIKYVIIGDPTIQPDANYVNKLKKRIDFFEKLGVKVIVFVPHVRVAYDIKGCYARPLKSPTQTCELAIEEHKKMLGNFRIISESLKRTNPTALVFDQNVLLCNEEKCAFKLGGIPAFRDEYAHYSEFASNELAKHFVSWAKVNAPELLAK